MKKEKNQCGRELNLKIVLKARENFSHRDKTFEKMGHFKYFVLKYRK